VKKTKTMTIRQKHANLKIKLEGTGLKQVTQFAYLGELLTEDEKCTMEKKNRIGISNVRKIL